MVLFRGLASGNFGGLAVSINGQYNLCTCMHAQCECLTSNSKSMKILNELWIKGITH